MFSESCVEMNQVYSLEKSDVYSKESIFLAGPTYRSEKEGFQNGGWRDDALDILQESGFDGTVYIPEFRDNTKPKNWAYEKQVGWELEALRFASVIVFWIPRDLVLLPAFTTNIEFGEWLDSGKIVVGAPEDAPKNRYVFERCHRENIPTSFDLVDCLDNALDMLQTFEVNHSQAFFTADTHFGQKRTLELSRRPFSSVSEMSNVMVENWNKTVGDGSVIYHLGDFGDPKYIQYLAGKQINIVPGNYDNSNVLEALARDKRVQILGSHSTVCIDDSIFQMIHDPEERENTHIFYLFGHIHKLQMVKINGLNVGVDCHSFKPICEDTVMFYHNGVMQHYDDSVFM